MDKRFGWFRMRIWLVMGYFWLMFGSLKIFRWFWSGDGRWEGVQNLRKIGLNWISVLVHYSRCEWNFFWNRSDKKLFKRNRGFEKWENLKKLSSYSLHPQIGVPPPSKDNLKVKQNRNKLLEDFENLKKLVWIFSFIYCFMKWIFWKNLNLRIRRSHWRKKMK